VDSVQLRVLKKPKGNAERSGSGPEREESLLETGGGSGGGKGRKERIKRNRLEGAREVWGG